MTDDEREIRDFRKLLDKLYEKVARHKANRSAYIEAHGKDDYNHMLSSSVTLLEESEIELNEVMKEA